MKKVNNISLGDYQNQLEIANKRLIDARKKAEAAQVVLENAEEDYKHAKHEFTLACQSIARDNQQSIF